MVTIEKYVGIILTRAGSKRIRHKNLKLMAGKPMMYYQIKEAQKVKEISKVVVATDSEWYADIARSHGADVVMRTAEVSGPKTKSEDSVLFVLDELEKRGEKYENVVLIQATSPLNKAEYMEEGIQKMNKGDVNSVLTYVKWTHFLLSDEEELYNRPMSQDHPPKEVETGCFWISNIEKMRETKNRVIKPFAKVEVPPEAFLEIDTYEDLFILEKLLERRLNIEEKRYYEHRDIEEEEGDYFDAKPDPDGNIRDITKEKDRRLGVCKQEIDFINGLFKNDKPGSPKRKFLDLGCGPGFVASAIDDKYEKYGLDTSDKAIELAKEFIPNLHHGILEPDTYEEETFDVIFCNHVIEHVPEPIPFMETVQKILKTHGVLVLATPNFDCAAARRFGEKFRLLHDKTHTSLFSDFGLKQMLDDLGFQVNKIEYPFFDTEYFTEENLLRMFDNTKMSPAFYGNFMTFYCQKK